MPTCRSKSKKPKRLGCGSGGRGKRRRRRSRLEGQVEGRAGTLEFRRQVQFQGPRTPPDGHNAIDQDEDLTGFPDVSAFELRRARLGVEGVVFWNVAYKFEVDFANDVTAIKDAYVEYNGLADGLSLRVGNFKTPNSLDEMTSSRFLTFLERAAFVETSDLDRQIRAGVIYARDPVDNGWGWATPCRLEFLALEPEFDEVWRDDVKTGAARVTVAPIDREVNGVHQVLHFGASWRERHGAQDLRSGLHQIHSTMSCSATGRGAPTCTLPTASSNAHDFRQRHLLGR